MNLHRRDRLACLCAFTLILVATSHRATLAGERKPPQIECEVSIPCTVEEAWAAWTTPAGLESFLARSAKVTLEKGGEYAVDLGAGSPGDHSHSRSARILHIDAPRTLSFEWVIPLPQAAARDSMTVVTVHIEAVSPRRCRVRLAHTGWSFGEEDTEAFAYSERSWKMALRNLRSALTARGRGR